MKGTIEPNVLYSVELKPMHKAKGYVVVDAIPVPFPATVDTIIAPKTLYKITVSFGNKTIYLDPKDGKSAMSRTLDGVLPILKERKDIENHKEVIADFIKQVQELIRQFEQGEYIYTGKRYMGRGRK